MPHKDPEVNRAYWRAYRQKHLEKCRAYERDYRQKKAREIAVIQRRYNQKNTAKRRHYVDLRRARRAGAPVNDLTAQQWRDIQATQEHRCAYCDKRCKGHLTQDHIIPLSKGGSHTLHNVIGACQSCNSRKQDGAPLTAVQPLLI